MAGSRKKAGRMYGESHGPIHSYRNEQDVQEVLRCIYLQRLNTAAMRIRGGITRVYEAVSLKVVTLEKSHVTHGACVRFHP